MACFVVVTDVQPEIRPEVMGKVWETADDTDIADGFARWRPPRRTPYNRMLDSTCRVPATTVLPILWYPC